MTRLIEKDVYILDTGIYDRHAFFEGRVVTAFDAFGDAPDIRDPNGHGTYTAGERHKECLLINLL